MCHLCQRTLHQWLFCVLMYAAVWLQTPKGLYEHVRQLASRASLSWPATRQARATPANFPSSLQVALSQAGAVALCSNR